MPTITTIRSLLDIADSFDAFCIDMWGVVWDGHRFFDGVLEVLAQLKAHGKTIFILSNSTEPRKTAEDHYAQHGLFLKTHYDGFLSSAYVLEQEVEKGFFERLTGQPNYAFYLIGNKPAALFQRVARHITPDMDMADFVYLGSPSAPDKPALDIAHLLPDMREALKRGLPAVVANPDYYAFKGDVKYCVQGLTGVWYADHGGRVMWVGKPYPLIYEYALNLIQKPAKRCLMIGDTLRTDIMGGHQAGMKTLLVTGTGMTAADLTAGTDLETLCRTENVTPDYTIERFR